MSNIQDLEQELTRCWDIVEDLKLIGTDEALALAIVYNLRFEKAEKIYELLVKEYYELKKLNSLRDVNFDEDIKDDLAL
jgi:hypothetical protein